MTLETRAYLALQGVAGPSGSLGDWRADLVALFRSRSPLGPEIREALAQAFEDNLNGFRLELVADGGEKKRRQDHYRGVLTRRMYVDIGEWILQSVAGGESVENALRAASQRRETGWPGYKGCDAALTYTRRLKRWRSSLDPDHPLVRAMGEGIEDLFHERDAAHAPLDQGPTGSEVD